MYAVIVINVEIPLEGSFHYYVPADLRSQMHVGQLVEVEFGRRLAQGITLSFDDDAPVEDTKPIISIIDPIPVVESWQIDVAKRVSETYLTALNQCMRLMLPPGLTRWSDITVELNRYWDGEGRLTEAQKAMLYILREKGDMRGRKLKKEMPKKFRAKTLEVVRQLVNRKILNRGSVLELPRSRPKNIHTAELKTDPARIRDEVVKLGRSNKKAAVLNYLDISADPLPKEADLIKATGATKKHLKDLEADGLIERVPEKSLDIEMPSGDINTFTQAAAVGLAMPPKDVLGKILDLRGAHKYHRVLTYLAAEAQPKPLSEIYAATEATRAVLNKLAKLELIRFGSKMVWRDSMADRDFVTAEAPDLTLDQARVWGRVKVSMMEAEKEEDEDEENEEVGIENEEQAVDDPDSSFNIQHSSFPPSPPKPILLHGVTGSGKTEIYMRAIDYALERGQTAMVLVPEIALAPQTVRRFAARFPGRVAVMHSRLSDGERYDTWRRARLGMFDIIVGPRSAMFIPLKNLGVIVLDEEHDQSYKQGPPVPAPYYHARDVAIMMGEVTGAAVILGSATPDIVTYHRAQAGQYQLLELPRRVMGHRGRIESQMERVGRTTAFTATEGDPDDALTIPLPPVTVVDLRNELRAGNRSVFSRVLVKEIEATLERKEQVILFLNRRGSATHVFCRDCGHVQKCPNCDMPLTFHHRQSHLTCHHCNHREAPPAHCPECRSKRIKYFGLGTEQLEELVKQQWPQARTVRWDRDTTAGRDKHEELLAKFVDHEADILIGTQMIAKGLDLPLVTLVGVISADVSINLPDFRTGERTFQVLTQVAGRAGRGLLGGRVILQTYEPEHYAIKAAAQHDFEQFYLAEIRFRTQHNFPPYRRMAKLVTADPAPQRAEHAAKLVATDLRALIRELRLGGTQIIGPTPPFFGRIDRRFRWQILIRSSDPTLLLREYNLPRGWVVDIDPVSTL